MMVMTTMITFAFEWLFHARQCAAGFARILTLSPSSRARSRFLSFHFSQRRGTQAQRAWMYCLSSNDALVQVARQ